MLHRPEVIGPYVDPSVRDGDWWAIADPEFGYLTSRGTWETGFTGAPGADLPTDVSRFRSEEQAHAVLIGYEQARLDMALATVDGNPDLLERLILREGLEAEVATRLELAERRAGEA